MRIVVVQRSAHAHEVLRAPDGVASLPWSSSVVETLDRADYENKVGVEAVRAGGAAAW